MPRWIYSLIACSIILLFNCSAPDHRPNILIIFTDDQGFGDVAINGNDDLDTPRLDAFARESVQLRHFTAQPVCSPSRATLLTGRHFLKTGVWGVHGGRDYLNLDETTIAEILSDNGYYTAMFGKWHLGKQGPYLPQARGFDDTWRQTDLYAHENPEIDHNGDIARQTGWTVDYLTDRALEVLMEDRDQPWFAYLAYPQIHEPYFAPESLVLKYQEQGNSPSLATLYAMTEQLDNNVGRLLDALEESGKDKNTVVFFMGDNGPIGNPINMQHLSEAEMARRNPLNLRGNKGHVLENGCRVPAFVRWPDKFPARVLAEYTDLIDLFPTLLDLAEVKDREITKPIDGVSLMPLLTSATDTLATRDIFYSNHDTFWPERTRLYSFLKDKSRLEFGRTDLALRRGDFKLVQSWQGSLRALFDIQNDPEEKIPLNDSLPAIYASMYADLEHWWRSDVIAASNSYNMPVFQIGFPGEKIHRAYACAPDAVFGEVYTDHLLTRNWREEGAGLDLKLDVVQGGRYQIRVKAKAGEAAGDLYLKMDDLDLNQPASPDGLWTYGTHSLPAGPVTLSLRLGNVQSESNEAVIEELWWVEFEKAD